MDEQGSPRRLLDVDQLELLQRVGGLRVEESFAVTGDVRRDDEPKVVNESRLDQNIPRRADPRGTPSWRQQGRGRGVQCITNATG